MKAEFRIYGTVFGLDEATAGRLVAQLPLEGVGWDQGVLDIDHEGPWADHEAAAEIIAAALPPGARGSLDVIDNAAWSLTRYSLGPACVAVKTMDLNDVLDGVRTS